MKTKEELLKPRFLLIADFPDNHYGKVGTILDRNWSKYPNDDETKKPIWSISDFPHLFRELKWYEERAKYEMPKYVEFNKIITKVGEWDLENKQGWICVNIGGGRIYQDAIMPSSEEEFIKSQKL